MLGALASICVILDILSDQTIARLLCLYRSCDEMTTNLKKGKN